LYVQLNISNTQPSLSLRKPLKFVVVHKTITTLGLS